jgi:chaperonin GroEL
MSLQIPKVETNRDIVQEKIRKASQTLYDVAKSAYGPGSGNVILGFRHGPPMLSRDGVTNIKMVRSEDPHEDDIIQAIKEASEKNNKKVGDGTTAVTILEHHLLLAAQKLEGKGFKPMEIAQKLNEAQTVAIAYIDKIKKPVKGEEFLQKVATISANDKNLGAMIADIMKEVGKDGGVIIEQYEGLGVHNELIDGFYFEKGYKDTDLINDVSLNQSDHKDIPILISSKVFATAVDIKPVLEKMVSDGIKECIILAEVKDEALAVLKMSKSNGIFMGIPVDPPFVVGGRTLFLDDCAIMTGAIVYEGSDFNPSDYLGFAKEVVVTEHATTILGGDSDTNKVKERIASLREQLKESDHPQSVQFIKDRLGRLTGRMAIIKVGGALELEREETKLRVQDAVCAVQSAMKDGVVPGGGTTLARVTGTEFDDAFKEPFRQLTSNAGLNPDKYLAYLEASKLWYGYNLKSITEEPVDLLEIGVIDPSLVIKEVVRNATSIVAGLITAGVSLSYVEKE